MTDELPPIEERRSTDDDDHDLIDPLGVGILTVSSSRAAAADDPENIDDPGGDEIETILTEAGHVVTVRELVPDDYVRVATTVSSLVDREDVDLVITTGGTGVTVDDVSPDAVSGVFDTMLPGFGELFRMLSYEEVASRAMASRATAGIARGVPIFVLPGSVNAVRLATEELIVPEAPHLAGLATRHRYE